MDGPERRLLSGLSVESQLMCGFAHSARPQMTQIRLRFALRLRDRSRMKMTCTPRMSVYRTGLPLALLPQSLERGFPLMSCTATPKAIPVKREYALPC